MNKVEGIILDWAGTAVDFGCMAPVNVFIDIFKDAGIDVTKEEARKPMGLLKIDHIRAMLDEPRIAELWQEKYQRPYEEKDVHQLYAKFESALMASLAQFTDPIPEVVETIDTLKREGLKVGSTTGYTQKMMDVVVPNAAAKGYQPDFYLTPDDTNSLGRPYPYMIYRNMEELKLTAAWKVVKVGDTTSDMEEGINAGVWTIGVIVGSSEMGLSHEEYEALTVAERESITARTEKKFKENGADFTIRSMTELPNIIATINQLISEGKRPKNSTELAYI